LPELPREKDEAMAQFLARGFSKVKAHEAAGFAKNTGNAHTKANREDMIERVAELKEKIGLDNDLQKELDETDPEDITEAWLIGKYRILHDKAIEDGDFKAAKMCLDEIGAMKTLGDQNVKANNSKALDLKNDANTPAPQSAINLQIFTQGVERFADGVRDIAATATDITPREDGVGDSDDGDGGSEGTN